MMQIYMKDQKKSLFIPAMHVKVERARKVEWM